MTRDVVEELDDKVTALRRRLRRAYDRIRALRARDRVTTAQLATARADLKDATRGAWWQAPIKDPAPGVTNEDQLRAVLAELNRHIADALDERDQLLERLLVAAPVEASRYRLPGPPYAAGEETTRRSRVIKLRVGARRSGTTCHLFLGFYPHGELGEMFVQLGRGLRTTLAGGGFHWGAKMFSLARQHGTPVAALLRQMRYDSDASGGMPYGADDKPIKGTTGVKSLVDYLGIVVERVVAEEVAARTRTAAELEVKP